MNILSVPYIFGGLSHFLPLFVLNQKISRNDSVHNHFLVNKHVQNFLKIYKILYLPTDYILDENLIINNEFSMLNRSIMNMEEEAFNFVKPSIIIEDTSFLTPLIAEKKDVPRISIQRTGIFRTIESSLRNPQHTHSMQKGGFTKKSEFFLNDVQLPPIFSTSDSLYLNKYNEPKVKVIPGIQSIECLPINIDNKESYFYSGPLIVMDKPSANLSERINKFLSNNKDKPIVFITTGTIDRTPIERYIEYFANRNYAVITTIKSAVNDVFQDAIFYNGLLPLNYIASISNLMIHQCGSGIYHYPIMNRIPSLTIGTQCFDREDIALKLQQLGVSSHIPHPDDNDNYWNIFVKLVNKFEKNTLVNFNKIEELRDEIIQTSQNFKIKNVFDYALS